ncbi:MAG: lysostaphin resistance A-like protein [Mycoplasmoidaceae bacterium]
MEQKNIRFNNYFQNELKRFGAPKEYKENFEIRDMLFFFTFYIFIKIIWNVIRTIIYPDWTKTVDDFFENNIFDDKNKFLFIYYFDIVFIKVFCPMIGVIWIFKKNTNYFLKNRFWILLYFYPGRLIISQILFYTNIDNNSLNLIASVIIPLIILIIYFIKNYDFLHQLKTFFNKSNIKFFALLSSIGLILFILAFSILGSITIAIGGGQPDNESNIQSLLKSPYSIVIMFFSIVIIAPLIEEFVFRSAIAEVASNKWWAWPISTIFFAFVHISESGDWINILIYIPMGLISGFSYYKFRNITFPILLHFGNNLVAFIGYFV